MIIQTSQDGTIVRSCDEQGAGLGIEGRSLWDIISIEQMAGLQDFLDDPAFGSLSYREKTFVNIPGKGSSFLVSMMKGNEGGLTVLLDQDRAGQAQSLAVHFQKEGPTRPEDSQIYEDLTRITNEMMSMQRQLENANRELAYQKERIRVTMDSIGEGVVSTDKSGNVQYINDQGQILLGLQTSCIGKPVHDVIPGILHEEESLEGLIGMAMEDAGQPIRLLDVTLCCDQPPCPVLDITLSAIKDRSGDVAGGVVVFFKDVSEKKRAQEALSNANRKLNLLSSITRHDLLNTLTVLNGYLELAHSSSIDEVTKRYLDKMVLSSERMLAQISATRDYQEVGVKEAVWVDLPSVIRQASSQLDLGSISMDMQLPEQLRIFADPMVNKVFYNLMENTLRHGKGVSTMSFRIELENNHLELVYSDDGVGVEEEYKEKIFRREHYSNTGFGLFLSREILGITGMTIREDGVPGQGARFRIRVPPGSYRGLD
ncbi:MAG: ATP-binding protein [Candidatus Methanomethylophilaceae archaeon]|nr:ATP-binding protein [Candidatus Methanomethylophilaceae archaeon]